MRNTIVSNGWNTTEWGLGFLRVSSFPLDPSCTFDTEEEFQNYLQGNDTDKPYLGQLISVNSDKYHVYVVQEYNGTEWTARPLNEDEIAELGDKINELKEKVETDLQDLESRLKGDHLTENYDTLSKIQDILIQHRTAMAQLFQNFQDEINKTQEGVGLDQSGSYSPDQETNYLKSATSVMNALRILDRLIYKLNFVYEDTNTIQLVPTYDEDTGVTTFTANVKISSEDRNQIQAKEDGLYHMSELAYSNGILTHIVNGKVVSTHDIGISGLVEESYYDVTTEKIVIIFKLHSGESQRVEIPASNLIEEWVVQNPGDSPIELTRTRVVNGKDELSADIRLSEKPNNILTKDGNTLYVKGTTDNIQHNGEVLKEIIDKFQEKPYVFNSYQEAVDANLPIGETFLLSQTEEVPIDFLVPHDGYIIWAEDETWWSQVYLYLFDSDNQWITAWPGDTFTGSFKINDTYYKYWDLGNIEEGKVLSSIFSNGSGTQFDGPSIIVNKNYYLKLTNNSFEIIDDLKTTTYYQGLYVVTENGFKALSLDEELKENLEGLVVRVDDLGEQLDSLNNQVDTFYGGEILLSDFNKILNIDTDPSPKTIEADKWYKVTYSYGVGNPITLGYAIRLNHSGSLNGYGSCLAIGNFQVSGINLVHSSNSSKIDSGVFFKLLTYNQTWVSIATKEVRGIIDQLTSKVKDLEDIKVNKASGLKSNYNTANYKDTPYYSTDTKEILLNGDNYGGGIQVITQKTLDTNYTPDTADVYEVRSNTEVDELQLTFTPLSPLSLTVPETIGDIKQGTTSESLKGKPISEILDSILFKTIYPTITDPSVTIGASTATVEAGSTLVTQFTNNFNRGSVVVNDGVTANKSYVGTATSTIYQVKVTGGTANANAGVSAYPNANDADYTTVARYEPGTYQYKVVIGYGVGPTMTTSKGASPNPMPTTNKGNVTNPHPAGSVSSSYGLIRNVTLPVFIDIANGTYTKQALRNWGAMTYTGVAMQDTTRSNPIRIKTPRKLQSVNSYNAVSGKYDVSQLTNFIINTVTNSTNGKDYTYYEYIWNGGAMSAVNMEIKTY